MGMRWARAAACVGLGVTVSLGVRTAWGARPNEPVLKISLDELGFQPPVASSLNSLGAMYTLHYVDDTHLLLTFNARTLLARLPDATPDDFDRNVSALLLELPTGRVVAKTEWRTRDHDQYLWALGHGRFALRVRTKLVAIDPVGNLAGGAAFKEAPLVEMGRRIGYVAVSPGGDLMTVETLPASTPPLTGAAASTAALAGTVPGAKPAAAVAEENVGRARERVEVNFYRLTFGEKTLAVTAAGRVAAATMIHIPATAEGYLEMTREDGHGYLFDFETHTGKKTELAGYETTCSPQPYFVSRSEFVAFGCHGSADKVELGGFDLRGGSAWVAVLGGQHLAPMILPAPAAGRFALSRILVSGSYVDPETQLPDSYQGQEITVLQNYDGRQLLKVMAAPVQRTEQNFDLSPDGLALCVIRGGNIEVYKLPGLNGQDQKQLRAAAGAVPEKNEAPVKLNAVRVARKEIEAAPEVVGAAAVPGESAPVAAAAPGAVAAPPAIVNGDAAPEAPRKAPTLYDAEHPKKPE